MAPVVHPGRLLKREMIARKLSANRLSLDIGVPSGRITDILTFVARSRPILRKFDCTTTR
jgi:antitoxin HigA-1